MKKKQNFLIFPILVMGAFLVFANSCKKDENDDPDIETGSFTDPRDGSVYKTIIVGNQEWMAENLRFLPSVIGPTKGSTTSPYYYVYGYNGTSVADAKATSNYSTYGVLYNWVAATTCCPEGWHLPNDSEWNQLIDYLGGQYTAGGKLKEEGTSHWIAPNTGATNSSGFTGLPGGEFASGDGFFGINSFGLWWSETENAPGSSIASYKDLRYSESSVNLGSLFKEYGFSVRCVKD